MKLLDDLEVRIQLTYTSASGKRTGLIIQDLDNESLKSEEGSVALRTNTPESAFRAIFLKGIFFKGIFFQKLHCHFVILCKIYGSSGTANLEFLRGLGCLVVPKSCK